jgi:hypothetical protein
VKLSLNGTIPAKTSYLIRCEAQDTSTPELISLNIDTYDQEWSQTIDNKQFRIVLYNGTTIVDGISQGEEAVEGAALASGTASKQKALRRIAFADTNDNQADFEVVEYKKASVSGDTLATMRPRSLADGPWKAGDKYVSSTTAPVDPETPSTGETETETEEQSEKQTEKQTEPETNVQTEPETAGGSGETEKIQTPSIDKTTETEEGTTFTGTVKKVKAKVVTSGKKKSVKLSWKKAKGATKYMIYRSTKANKGFKRIAVIKKGSITTYTDKKVKKGKKYYYRVVAAKNGIYGKAVKSKAVKIKK